MEQVQNAIWGPALWMILHSSAERIGTKRLNRLPQEEIRIWTGLLSSLKFSLPCPQCKKHYTQYFNTHPLSDFSIQSMRKWLYMLHVQVNERTNKSNELTIEDIADHYSKPFQFTKYYAVVSKQMMASLRLGISSREDIQRTLRYLEEMSRFYDFF